MSASDENEMGGHEALKMEKLQEEKDVKTTHYYHTAAMGMMDIALITANANQLRNVHSNKFLTEDYRKLMMGMIITSLFLQVIKSIVLMAENHTIRRRKSANPKSFKKTHNFQLALTLLSMLIIINNVIIAIYGNNNANTTNIPMEAANGFLPGLSG